MQAFRFANIEYLYLFLIIPILIAVFILMQIIKKRDLKRFGNSVLLKTLMPESSKSRPVIKFILLLIAFSFIILVIARPQFGSKLKEVKRKGIELIIALDVSNSMLAQDIEPNRLEAAKRAIINLVNKLEDDKIGMIVFAGDAYVQVPLTDDYGSAKMFLNSIHPGIVSKQGTAIGSAINLASRSFSTENELNKALIIISDGENHEDDAVAAAKSAAELGIRIYTIGIGKPEGVPIPVDSENNFQKDNQGNTIITKLNEQILQEIANIANGAYIRANNSLSALTAIYNEINKIEKKEIDTKMYSDYEDHFQFLALMALLFIVIEFFVLTRKNRKLSKINLFKI
jgi:Ca-activated chloride channel family protein